LKYNLTQQPEGNQMYASMTRQHFKAIAEVIKGLKEGRKEAAEAMADAVAKFNPQFNRTTFLKACGV
jgi:hypothetical protein